MVSLHRKSTHLRVLIVAVLSRCIAGNLIAVDSQMANMIDLTCQSLYIKENGLTVQLRVQGKSYVI